MNHYVYEITNLVNGKKYIGKRSCCCPIEEDKYMGSGVLLHKAFKKYGIENFKKNILAVCTSENMAFEYEEKITKHLRVWDNPNYYNMKSGGRGGMTGYNPNEETRDKFRKKAKLMWEDDEFRSNTINKLKNPSEETSRRLSEASIKKWANKDFISKQKESRKKYWENSERKKELSFKMSIDNPMKKESARKKLSETKTNKVICINNMQIFKSAIDAGEYAGVGATNIRKCCTGKGLTAGRCPMSNEPLIWRYYSSDNEEEYIEIRKNISKFQEVKYRKVVSINTGKIFNSLHEAGTFYNINPNDIGLCCNGKRRSAGKINNEKATWKFYNEYE